MKRYVAGFVFAAMTLTAATAMAEQMGRIGDFGAAQQTIDDALNRVEAVRREGHDDFGGHASRAEALLRQAKTELNAAAEYRAHH